MARKKKPTVPAARSAFVLRPNLYKGYWNTNHYRYCDRAKQQFLKMEEAQRRVVELWPSSVAEQTYQSELTPELQQLVEDRELYADTTGIFAAMSIEAFLNFYGVYSMGEAEYVAHFERLPIIPKLRQLLLICQSVRLPISDPLVKSLTVVADGRNALVHPKATEGSDDAVGADRSNKRENFTALSAETSIREMENFFREFAELVPDMCGFAPGTD